MKQSNLPAIKDLYSDKVDFAKQNDLNVLLNQKPKAEWVKNHPLYDGVKYLPIQRVEWLMTSIFIKWYVEVKQVQLIANSVVVTIRVHYQNPISDEMLYQDGVGAAPLQTNKGAGAADWDKIKNDAVMKALPAAKSFAVKDACEVIGKLFGKDMNRADEILYDSLLGKLVPASTSEPDYTPWKSWSELKTISDDSIEGMIFDCRTQKELLDLWHLLTEMQQKTAKDWKEIRSQQLKDEGIYV